MRQSIRTAESEYTTVDLGPGVTIDATNRDPADRAFVLHSRGRELGPHAGKTATDVPPIVAFVNEGRWIVECPFCHSAQVGSPDDPRFLCVCANDPVLGAYLQVEYPAPADRARIEDALSARTWVGNVNWLPEETANDLVAENIEQGVVRL